MRGPVTLLKDAWGTFMMNPKLFFGIYLVPALLTALFTILYGSEPEMTSIASAGNTIVFIVFMIVLVVVSILMGIAIIKAVSDPTQVTVKGAYEVAKKFALSYTWIAILIGFAVLFGLVLLIIPGIIFAVWFGFSYYCLLFEDKRGVEALKASKAYVKGKFWAVLGRYAFLGIVAIVVSVVIGIITVIGAAIAGQIGAAVISFVFNAVLTPVAIAYSYLMYKDLSSGAVATDDLSISPQPQPEAVTAQSTV